MSWDGRERRDNNSIAEVHSSITVIEGKVDSLNANMTNITGKLDKIYTVLFEGNGKMGMVTRIEMTENNIGGLLKREGNRNKAVISVAVGFIVTMGAVFLDVIRGK